MSVPNAYLCRHIPPGHIIPRKHKLMLNDQRPKLTERRRQLKQSAAYRALRTTAKVMDKYGLDPLMGLLPGGIGDMLSALLALPAIYMAAVGVRSLPLTLAVVFNILRDVALGLIPFWIGDAIDFFNRSYLQNLRLIVGFVEEDEGITGEVNRKAAWLGAGILLLCAAIALLAMLAARVAEWVAGLF